MRGSQSFILPRAANYLRPAFNLAVLSNSARNMLHTGTCANAALLTYLSVANRFGQLLGWIGIMLIANTRTHYRLEILFIFHMLLYM